MNRKVLVISVALIAAGAVTAFAQETIQSNQGTTWGYGANRFQNQTQTTQQYPAYGGTMGRRNAMGNGMMAGPNGAYGAGPGMMAGPNGQMDAGPGMIAGTGGAMGAMRQGAMMGFAGDVEESELSGTLQLAEGTAPKLVVDSETYTLVIPPTLAGEVSVDNGDTIQVTGFAFECPNADLLGVENVMHVRVLQVGNDRYISAGRRW